MNTSTEKVLFPHVTHAECDNDTVRLTLKIPEDLFYFKGHFPGNPILPGIVQLHWAIKWIKSYFNAPELCFNKVSILKFQQITTPNQTIELMLEKSENKEKQFRFNYSSALGSHASGRIIFD